MGWLARIFKETPDVNQTDYQRRIQSPMEPAPKCQKCGRPIWPLLRQMFNGDMVCSDCYDEVTYTDLPESIVTADAPPNPM